MRAQSVAMCNPATGERPTVPGDDGWVLVPRPELSRLSWCILNKWTNFFRRQSKRCLVSTNRNTGCGMKPATARVFASFHGLSILFQWIMLLDWAFFHTNKRNLYTKNYKYTKNKTQQWSKKAQTKNWQNLTHQRVSSFFSKSRKISRIMRNSNFYWSVF